MLKSVQIQIPKPCHENWNNMMPDQKGRFCGACRKVVVDFTIMSDKELLDYISNVAGNHTCGRFSTHQLNTDIKATESKKRFSWAYVWNVLLASLLATETYAQGEPQIENKSETHLPDVSPTPGTFAAKERDTVPAEKIVQGIILHGKTNEPLPYTYVTIKGTTKSVVSNEKGEFRIAVENKDSVMLEFAGVGYESQTLSINKNSNVVNIRIMMDEAVMGITVVAYHFTFKQKVKRFFRRTIIAPFKRL